MSSISAGTTSGTALVSAGDTSGTLLLKTNGTTTALTLGTDQTATFAANAVVTGTLNMSGSNLLYSALGTNAVSSSSNVTTLNYTNGAVFTSTATENTTITPSNVPTGGCTILLKLTNGGAYTVSFAGTPVFEGGTAPTLTASGTDYLFLVCTSSTSYAVFTKLDVKAA